MTEAELKNALSRVLVEYSRDAFERIRHVIGNLPEKARSLSFEIFPSQDGDGFFAVQANLDGPDLYVLNKQLGEEAEIFCPRHLKDGLEPAIPLVDPFEANYAVNDLVVDTVAAWLADLWRGIDSTQVSIPVFVVGHDDYGTVTPIELTSIPKNF